MNNCNQIIVSSRRIWWVFWFNIRYAAAHRENLALTFSEENNTSYRFTKFAGYLNWEVRFSGTEISLILKTKMVAAGISLKIIYLFFYWLVLIGRRMNLLIGDMYNRYTCPLQPCRHLTLKLLIQGHPRSAKYPT